MSKNHIFQGVRKKVEKKSFFSSFFQFYCFLSKLKQFGHGNSFSLHCSPFSEKKKIKNTTYRHCKGVDRKKIFLGPAHTPYLAHIWTFWSTKKWNCLKTKIFSFLWIPMGQRKHNLWKKSLGHSRTALELPLFVSNIHHLFFFPQMWAC